MRSDTAARPDPGIGRGVDPAGRALALACLALVGSWGGPAVAQARRAPSSTSSVIELESLIGGAAVSAGSTLVQPMAGFGPGWGGDAQLFWRPPAPTESPIRNFPSLSLLFTVTEAGTYDLTLFHTVAPDFGDYTVLVAGRPGSDVHGFNASVALSRARLGAHRLAAGGNQLTVTVFGKSAASTGYLVGLDRLELKRVDGPAMPSRATRGDETESTEGPGATRASQLVVQRSDTSGVAGLQLPALSTEQAAELGSRARPRVRLEALGRRAHLGRGGPLTDLYETRRIELDWQGLDPHLDFRWRVDGASANGGSWQVFDTPPTASSRRLTPLASGPLPAPVTGDWTPFAIDISSLVPEPPWDLPAMDFPGAPKFKPGLVRPYLYVRVVPSGPQAPPGSNLIVLAFAGRPAPGKLKVPPGPSPSVQVVAYRPMRPYARDFLCWGVAQSDGPKMPIEPAWHRGDKMYMCRKSSSSGGVLGFVEGFANAFASGLGAFIDTIASGVDQVSAFYNEVKSAAVDLAAGAFAQVGCGDPCHWAVGLALDAALASAGVPPSLPDFDQAMADLEQGGLDAVAKTVADAAVSQGVPGPLAEEAAKQAVGELAAQARKAVQSKGGGSAGGAFTPDLDRAYRPGSLVLEFRNDGTRPSAETVVSLLDEDALRVPVQVPADGPGSFFGFERLQVGGYRWEFLRIPPLRPGTTLRAEIVLDPFTDPHLWLELWERSNELLLSLGYACGSRPPYSPAAPDNDALDEYEACQQRIWQQWNNYQQAAFRLNSAFADAYGSGNARFELRLMPGEHTLHLNCTGGNGCAVH